MPTKEARTHLRTLAARAWRARNTEHVKQVRAAYRPKARVNVRAWAARNRDHSRARRRFHDYGISPHEVEKMLSAQGSCCAICGAAISLKTAHVDHDHATEIVRGLLCGPCNRGLGIFHDSVDALAAAIKYLQDER
jgi:hypothetical protein